MTQDVSEEDVSGGEIVLKVELWPVYLGVSLGHSGGGKRPVGEPFGQPGYERGQIHWQADESGIITGRARVFMPKGVYTHFVFCSGCIQDSQMGCVQMDQPVVFDRSGFMDVEPINNGSVR